EPFVERSAFVRLDVAEGYPLEPLEIDDPCGCRRNRGKQKALPAMKQQRLVRIDQELVESDAGGGGDPGDINGEGIKELRDFIDSRFHDSHSGLSRAKTYNLYVLRSPRLSGQDAEGPCGSCFDNGGGFRDTCSIEANLLLDFDLPET